MTEITKDDRKEELQKRLKNIPKATRKSDFRLKIIKEGPTKKHTRVEIQKRPKGGWTD